MHDIHHIALQTERAKLHQQQHCHRKYRQHEAIGPTEDKTRLRLHRRLDEFRIRQQLQAAVAVPLQRHMRAQLRFKMPKVLHQQVKADQRIKMQSQEDRRHKAEGKHHRHGHAAKLRNADGFADQQILIGGREGGGEQKEPDKNKGHRAKLRRFRTIIDGRDQFPDIGRRVKIAHSSGSIMTLVMMMQVPQKSAPKQKRRGKAPRRFAVQRLIQGQADFAMISSAILRGTGS